MLPALLMGILAKGSPPELLLSSRLLDGATSERGSSRLPNMLSPRRCFLLLLFTGVEMRGVRSLPKLMLELSARLSSSSISLSDWRFLGVTVAAAAPAAVAASPIIVIIYRITLFNYKLIKSSTSTHLPLAPSSSSACLPSLFLSLTLKKLLYSNIAHDQ